MSGHERGRAGGGWGDGNDALSSSPSQSLRSGYRHVHSPIGNKSQNNGTVGVVGGVARDQEASYTEQERLLVEEITAPGGVKAAPPRESLNAFINRSDIEVLLSDISSRLDKTLCDRPLNKFYAVFI